MDADDTIAPKLTGPEMARIYRNYLLTCRRLGVEPVPRDRAQDLIAERFKCDSGRQISPADYALACLDALLNSHT